MEIAGDQHTVVPIYLICEESAAMNAALGGLKECVAGLIADIVSSPLISDVVSLGLITFSAAPQVAFRRWEAWLGLPSYDLPAGGPARWGPAFRTLASVLTDDVRLLRADGFRVYRPFAFFLVSSPPQDPDWNWVFRETLTYDRETGAGLKGHPIFFPVRVGAAVSDETLRGLVYPQSKASLIQVRDAAGIRRAVLECIGYFD